MASTSFASPRATDNAGSSQTSATAITVRVDNTSADGSIEAAVELSGTVTTHLNDE
jgi:hypothetical protein